MQSFIWFLELCVPKNRQDFLRLISIRVFESLFFSVASPDSESLAKTLEKSLRLNNYQADNADALNDELKGKLIIGQRFRTVLQQMTKTGSHQFGMHGTNGTKR